MILLPAHPACVCVRAQAQQRETSKVGLTLYRTPVVKAYAERWIHSVPQERLDHVLIQVSVICGVC